LTKLDKRHRWGIAAAAVVALLLYVAVAFFIVRPAVFLGVDGAVLAGSVAHETVSHFKDGECKRHAAGGWTCRIEFELDPGSGGAALRTYRVTSDGSGCWEAVRVNSRDRSRPNRSTAASGCIDILDLRFE
jgi:hypothetical protein